MEWTSVDERVDIRTAAAVRVGGVAAFGTLHWIAGDRLMIEVDGSFPAGEPAEIRLDLTPMPGTALVVGSVHRQLVTAEDEMERFVFRVVSVAEEDAERLTAWIAQVRVGGTVKDFSTLSAIRRARAPQSTWSEARVVLGRIDARVRPAPTVPQTEAGPESPNDRVRSALREVTSRRLKTPEVGPISLDIPVPD